MWVVKLLKLVSTIFHYFLKENVFTRDNAHDVDIFPDEKITKRSEPTKQAQTKINIVKGLQNYLNDLKNYLTTYQGFKTRFLIIKIFGTY